MSQEITVFEDDLSVPNETLIYFSKRKILLSVLILLAFLGLGIYGSFTFPARARIVGVVLGSILTLVLAYVLYSFYKDLNNIDPQVTINSKGIEAAGIGFYSWNEITKEDAISVPHSGTDTTTDDYLVYDYQDKKAKLDLDEFTVGYKELKHLLEIYRGRYTKSQTVHH
jgi:hypothetical protein